MTLKTIYFTFSQQILYYIPVRLETDLARQLLVPEFTLSFREHSFKSRLLAYRYDFIPATQVYPVSECVIRIKDFPWLIMIGPRHNDDAEGRVRNLTVFNVLISIQMSLLGAEQETDYDPKGALRNYKDGGRPKEVLDAYRKRVNEQNLVMWEESFRRIDWLNGRHYFEGLLDSAQSGEWILTLGRGDE